MPDPNSRTVLTSVRPQRVVTFVDRNDADWRDTCLRVIEFYSRVWGDDKPTGKDRGRRTRKYSSLPDACGTAGGATCCVFDNEQRVVRDDGWASEWCVLQRKRYA